MIDLYNLCRVLKKINVDVVKLETKDVDNLNLPFKLPPVKSKYYFHKTFGDKVELEKYVNALKVIDSLDSKRFSTHMPFFLMYFLCDTKFGFKLSQNIQMFENVGSSVLEDYLRKLFNKDSDEVLSIIKSRCSLFKCDYENIYDNVSLTEEMLHIMSKIQTFHGCYSIEDLLKYGKRFFMMTITGSISSHEYYEDTEKLESLDVYNVEDVLEYVKEIYPANIRHQLYKCINLVLMEYFFLDRDLDEFKYYVYGKACNDLFVLGAEKDTIINMSREELKTFSNRIEGNVQDMRMLYNLSKSEDAFDDKEEVTRYLNAVRLFNSGKKLYKRDIPKSFEYHIFHILEKRALKTTKVELMNISNFDLYNLDILRFAFYETAKDSKGFKNFVKELEKRIVDFSFTSLSLDMHDDDYLIFKTNEYLNDEYTDSSLPNYVEYIQSKYKPEEYRNKDTWEFSVIERILGPVLFPMEFNIFSHDSMAELFKINFIGDNYIDTVYDKIYKTVPNFKQMETKYNLADNVPEMIVICNLHEKGITNIKEITTKEIQDVLRLKEDDILSCVLIGDNKPFKDINIENVLEVNKHLALGEPVPRRLIDENTKHLVYMYIMTDTDSQLKYSTQGLDINDEESLNKFGDKVGISNFYNEVQSMLEKETSKVDFAPILMFKDRDKSLQYYICKEGSEFKEGTYKPLSLQFSIYDEDNKFYPVYYQCIYDKENRVINIEEFNYNSTTNRSITVDRLTGDRVKGDRDLLFVIPYYQFLCSTNITQEETLSSKSSSDSITLYYYDTRIVRVQESKEPVSTHKGGKHRFHKSPNEHIRKAHDRVMKSGKVVHIHEMKINKGKGLTIRKKEN